MSKQLYETFKRTGAYTIFNDDSQFLDFSTTGNYAVNFLVVQSRFDGMPTNTPIYLETQEQLDNTIGPRDRFMERRGCFAKPMAEILLSQGPLYVLNLRPYTEEHKLSVASLSLDDAAKMWSVTKTTQTKYTDLYDRTGFWKFDRTKVDSMSEALLNFGAFTSKNATLFISKPDMSRTEFAGVTVAEYNAANPKRPIQSANLNTLLTDLFVDVHVFSRDLAADLKSGLNASLSTYLKLDGEPEALSLLGATETEKLNNLTKLQKLPTAAYVNTYRGTVITDVLSSLNEVLDIETVFNADYRLHGMFARINRNVLDTITFAVDNGTDETKFAFTNISNGISLLGCKVTADQLVDGTALKQKSIVDMISSKGISTGVLQLGTNNFEYLVDAFKTYIEPASKWQFSTLAAKNNDFAYCYSAPSKRDFQNAKGYLDADGILDTMYIPMGGNPDASDIDEYSMPGETNGDYATFPFAPGILYNDGSSTDDTILPASALGAALYTKKYINANMRQYDIINGPLTGQINIANVVGVEDFTNDDLDNLEPFGWNCFIKNGSVLEVRNDGTAKNQGAKKSAMSYASNYELVRFLVAEGMRILGTKISLRNNETTRTNTASEITSVCKRLLSQEVIESYNVTCDITNNTAEVRKRGFLVLDTEIVTADGIRIALHRLFVKLKSDSTGVE